MPKEKWGIRIDFVPPKEKLGKPALEVKFFIEKGNISGNFVSTPEIRDAIRKYQKRRFGKKFGLLGRMRVSFNSTNNILTWDNYKPFEANKRIFSGKGIAETLELRVLKIAEQVFGRPRAIRHTQYGWRRRRQLKKRGIKTGYFFPFNFPFNVPFAEEKEKLREKIKKDVRVSQKKRQGFVRRMINFMHFRRRI